MADDTAKPNMSDAIANIRDLASQVGLGEKPTDDERIERLYPGERKPTHGHLPLKELDARGLRVVELIVFGLDDRERELANRLGVRLHDGLTPEMACDVAGLRRKNGRHFMADPLVKREIARLTKAMLDGAVPMAARRLIGLADQPVDDTAAAASVQLKAVALLLGDRVGPTKPGISVNIQNNVAVPLQAGIVLRLPANTPATPLEKTQAPMIEAQTNRASPVTIDAEAFEAEDALEETVRRNPHVKG